MHSDSEATLIQRSHAVQVEGSATPSRFHPRDTMLKVLCGVIQFQFDIDGQRATLAVFIPWFGSIFPKNRGRVTEDRPELFRVVVRIDNGFETTGLEPWTYLLSPGRVNFCRFWRVLALKQWHFRGCSRCPNRGCTTRPASCRYPQRIN
eukprot:scaffold34445_cov58-Phaeocystis_antarctica.AAC.2